MIRTILVPCVAAFLIVGCGPAAQDRSGRLLAMAAQEAAQISSSLNRFTRQLNIADTQIRTGRKADAIASLALARDTLASAEDKSFDSLRRIAGWTSLAQLSRAAGDRDMALKAADQALASLNDVTPVAERAQYVLSLATELERVRGKEDAVELLISGGTWAGEIMHPAERRTALTAFAYRLTSYEAYDAARRVLRVDADAAWRADTFLAMARGYDTSGKLYDALPSVARGGGRGGAGAASPEQVSASMIPAPASVNFGKDVSYESNFQQR
jgi:hypothetical protein